MAVSSSLRALRLISDEAIFLWLGCKLRALYNQLNGYPESFTVHRIIFASSCEFSGSSSDGGP